MSMETEVLLKDILFQIKMHGNIDLLEANVEAMCDEKTVAYINEKVSKARAKEAEKNPKTIQ